MQKELLPLYEKLVSIETKLDTFEQLLKVKITSGPALKTYTTREAALYLRLSVKRIYELLYAGKLQCLPRKKNTRLLFSEQQINQYLYEKHKH